MHPVPPVCISGMGCISAAGLNLAENLATLDTGIRTPRPPEWGGFAFAGPVFSCSLPPVKDTPHSRTVQLLMAAIREALAQAVITPSLLAKGRVGVCIGTSVGASLDFLESYRALKSGAPLPAQEAVTYFSSNPALAVAHALDTNGPVQTVTNACSSGADALGMAAQWIRDGLCDFAIAGGADSLARISYMGFSRLLIVDPQPCRPFDKNRKGLNLGEGAGVMILEAEHHLAARKGVSQGCIAGYGTATDAHHLTAPHPEARGLKAALQQALQQSGKQALDIAFINAHGTGTLTNDAIEGAFLREVFPHTPFIATKGCTGHTLGAAGAIEAIFTIAHLRDSHLPTTPGFEEADPGIGCAPTRKTTRIGGTWALSQSLAFGGNNSVLVLGTSPGNSCKQGALC